MLPWLIPTTTSSIEPRHPEDRTRSHCGAMASPGYSRDRDESPHGPSPAPTSTFTLRLQHKAVRVGNSHGSDLVTLFTLAGKDGNSKASGRSRGSWTGPSAGIPRRPQQSPLIFLTKEKHRIGPACAGSSPTRTHHV